MARYGDEEQLTERRRSVEVLTDWPDPKIVLSRSEVGMGVDWRSLGRPLAIRLGLALEMEEAGNRVARMEPSEVAAFPEDRGYVVLRAERYAMCYPRITRVRCSTFRMS